MPKHDSPLRVKGLCPHGCGETLQLIQGVITCSNNNCPDLLSVAKLLSNGADPTHYIQINDDDFSIEHPLYERVMMGSLHACPVGKWLHSRSGPPFVPGRYAVSTHGLNEARYASDWTWTPDNR